jgi:uncharacterized protein with HEPN domain
MQPDSKKYLFDIKRSSHLIAGFCAGRSFEQYVGDDMLKSAVERQFGVIGEDVDDRIVWGVVEKSLPGLIDSVEELLGSAKP